MKQIKVEYSQQGHPQYPEDTWDVESVVTNGEDLFQFMKECHLRDARNRNNYPITSHWEPNNLRFFERKVEVCNLGHEHYGEEIEIDKPRILSSGYRLYDEWVTKINSLIPILRDSIKRKHKERKEKEELQRLTEKYETN